VPSAVQRKHPPGCLVHRSFRIPISRWVSRWIDVHSVSPSGSFGLTARKACLAFDCVTDDEQGSVRHDFRTVAQTQWRRMQWVMAHASVFVFVRCPRMRECEQWIVSGHLIWWPPQLGSADEYLPGPAGGTTLATPNISLSLHHPKVLLPRHNVRWELNMVFARFASNARVFLSFSLTSRLQPYHSPPPIHAQQSCLLTFPCGAPRTPASHRPSQTIGR